MGFKFRWLDLLWNFSSQLNGRYFEFQAKRDLQHNGWFKILLKVISPLKYVGRYQVHLMSLSIWSSPNLVIFTILKDCTLAVKNVVLGIWNNYLALQHLHIFIFKNLICTDFLMYCAIMRIFIQNNEHCVWVRYL